MRQAQQLCIAGGKEKGNGVAEKSWIKFIFRIITHPWVVLPWQVTARRSPVFGDTIDGDVEEQELPVFAETDRWLTLYFQGQKPDFTPPIAFGAKVSEFRKEVWKILLSIPYGTTLTYGDIARQISIRQGIERMSAQAVGGAVGHNPISLIVPCHRVVGTNGSLTGYAGGIDKKVKLLQLEGNDMSKFFYMNHDYYAG